MVGRGRYDLSSQTYGSVPEWPKGADCKSAGIAYVGSNPARPTTKRPIAIAIGRLCFFNDVAVKGANPVARQLSENKLTRLQHPRADAR